MLKDQIRKKDDAVHKQEWDQFQNHVAWWEAEQPLAPLPVDLQLLLIKNDSSFVEQLIKFTILTESYSVWNKKTKRYDYTNPQQVLQRDRSWIWTLYLTDHPLGREGLKQLLKYCDYQEFNRYTQDTGTYNSYQFRNGNYLYSAINKNYFRYLKGIFKLAEKKQDTEILSHLAYRFETDRNYYARISSPDKSTSRSLHTLAFSPETRRYLAKRTWRSLRVLGKQNNKKYINFATTLLFQYSAKDAKRIRVVNPETNHTNYVQSYKENWVLNHLLYHHSTRFTYSSSTWQATPNAYFEEPEEREEAFPKLWDQHPYELLMLLIMAEAPPVIHFAGRALRLGNPAFVAQLSDAVIDQLLQSTVSYRQEFAVREVLNRLDKHSPDLKRWLALSTHPNRKIRTLANEFLQQYSAAWSDEIKTKLINICLGKIIKSPNEPYVSEWLSLFENNLHDVLAEKITLPMVASLLEHAGQATIQQFVSLLLPLVRRDKNAYTADDLLPFLENEVESIRTTARTILHNDYMLLSCTPAFLVKWCTIPYEDNQVFLTPFFVDRMHWLIPILPKFLDTLWAEMMQNELPEISRNYILNDLLGTLFLTELTDTPLDQVLALLDHSDTSYQELGARIFAAKKPAVDQFSLDQLLQLAHNQIALCRNEARNMIIQVKEQITDEWLINLVETHWDDTRNWGFAYIRTLSVEQFTPTLVYGLIDSARQDVQAFGMEMVEIHFADLDIAELLLRASESTDLFVQEYALSLAEKIEWNIDKITKLELFFRTILFKVHQARKAKQMTLDLLFKLGKKNRDMAKKVVPLLSDIAHVGGKRDFEQILFTLTQIKNLYPEIESPVQLR
ncbi:hypothetical protein MK805_00460 [Shimazuella sp. AN120528]|uniref:hypothetical protein n=1 Tax=Shimazuella soli TaxID=1892854 RepID=UPI001F0FAF47|nr:hypothetical protein [Shimazuella soli]MCH5583452.1 hypothetical protein [Shimazuella soli]